MSLQQILIATGGGSSIDPDAQAFITAAGITDPTQQDAINTLVVGMKSASIWTKMNACYPFVGGTATAHKYNLVDPRDLDAAFRLNFVGGWTHDANGATSNGTTGYADTFLSVSGTLTLNDTHIAMYSRTASPSNLDIGASNAGTTNRLWLGISFSTVGNNMIGDCYDGSSRINTAVSDALGLFISTRTASNSFKFFRDATQQGSTVATSSGGLPAENIYLACENIGGSATNISGRNYAFGSIGSGLSDADVSAYYTLVQAFQTTLGRNV